MIIFFVVDIRTLTTLGYVHLKELAGHQLDCRRGDPFLIFANIEKIKILLMCVCVDTKVTLLSKLSF